MKKVVLYFLFVLGFIAITGNMLRHSAILPGQVKQEKQLSYTIASDSQSPVELKQVNFLPASAAGSALNHKITPGFVAYVSQRVTIKYQTCRYPLFIKDLIGGPVFLRNNCLRI